MSINLGAVDELPTASSRAEEGQPVSTSGHHRLGSEHASAFAIGRSSTTDISPRRRAGGNTLQHQRHRTPANTGIFGPGSRLRFGSSPTHRHNQGRYGWKNANDSSASVEDDGRPKLVSLSDLIRKEDKVPATLLYEPALDTDALVSASDSRGSPQQYMRGGTVAEVDALNAAKHGNSNRLSKFLQDGGDPETVDGDHPMRWSLLHYATGSEIMGWNLASSFYRSRPEPDCTDGYATCVSELLAAGADPNVTSSIGGFLPLMSAALTGCKECCALLLRAGAQVDMKSNDGRTAFDFAMNAKNRGASTGVIAVLRDPPKKAPRSPTMVRAKIVKLLHLDPEDAVPPVEVRWRIPSQASLAPTVCGDVERYYIKCWCRGKGKEVIMTKTSMADITRRDFCNNQIIDRGVALRKNLSLPQSQTASTIVHGLQAGERYSFTVSCVAELEGALRHSPPSCMSKPLLMPGPREDMGWDIGGIVSMVTGKDSPSPAGPGDAGAAQQAHNGPEQSPGMFDQRGGMGKGLHVSWAEDDLVPIRPSTSHFAGGDLSTSPTGRFGRDRYPSGDTTLRRHSQSYSATPRHDTFGHASSANRQSFGGQGYSPPRFSLPLEYGMEGQQRPFDDNSTVSPVRRPGHDRHARRVSLETPRRSDGRFRSGEYQASYQDEGCIIG